MKFKFYLIALLGITMLFTLRSQNGDTTIGITSWINAPAESDLEKPLIYVDFWATWCAPCIGSMPHTMQLQQKFGSDVLFIILTDEPPAKAKAFIERKHWQALYAASDVSRSTLKRFRIKAIPHAILLDPGGKILWRGHPADMTYEKMQAFVLRYRGENGDPKRIRSVTVALQNKAWDFFIQGGDTLYYYKEKNAGNRVEKTASYLYVSGNDRFITGYAYNVAEKNVLLGKKPLAFYRFKMRGTNESKLKDLLKAFFKRIYPSVHIKTKREKVFLLTGGDTTAFLNPSMYDFGLGENTVMEDDYGISIDNATPAQMAEDLSHHCRFSFVYEGNTNKIFDWDIQYKNIDELIEFLIEELGFKVQKSEREVKILTSGG